MTKFSKVVLALGLVLALATASLAGSVGVSPLIVAISSGVSGLAANVATFLGTPSSANLAAAVTDETGTGLVVFGSADNTYTPTLSCGTGTLTSGSAAGHYVRLGLVTIAYVTVSIVTNGTCASSLNFSLPTTTTVTSAANGREIQSTGLGMTGVVAASSSTVAMVTSAGAYPVSGTSFVFTITYE